MHSLTKSPAFWLAAAFILYPLLFAVMLLFVIMPPLNMICVPLWFFVCAGAVGSISNGLDEARRARAAQRDALRNAPGVVFFQRTNAR